MQNAKTAKRGAKDARIFLTAENSEKARGPRRDDDLLKCTEVLHDSFAVFALLSVLCVNLHLPYF
jgi:hypothetical protein